MPTNDRPTTILPEPVAKGLTSRQLLSLMRTYSQVWGKDDCPRAVYNDRMRDLKKDLYGTREDQA